MREKSVTRIGFFFSIILFLVALPLVKAEAAAKPEGTLTAALYTLAEEGFLPDRNSGSTGPLWECVYSYLMCRNHIFTKGPIPEVAERWEYSKDFRTLTFYLRKGIQFHDGWGELTAEDVKWTMEFLARPASTSILKSALKQIKNMDVINRYTLVINFKDPEPMFWTNFSLGDNSAAPILCKKYVETVGEEKANRQPIGSGPYRLVEQKIGDFAKFEALDNHWMLVPEFKYLILRVVPEESTRIAMLKTGEIDIAMELEFNKVPEIEKAGMRTVVSSLADCIFLPFGGMLISGDKRYVEGYHRKDPWKDVRVREAMNIAIDRNALVKTFYRGEASPSPTFWTLPGWEKLESIPYNPGRAKQLLTEAGYPSGFGFKFYTHSKRAEMSNIGEAVAGYWEAIGIKPEIVRGDYATWRSINKTGKTAGYVWTHVNGNQPDWSESLTEYELPNAATPIWQSEETKTGIMKALQELDPQKREANFKQLAQLYRSTYSHVPIVYSPKVSAASKKVGEWNPCQLYAPKNIIFARHPKPLDTYRLFTP